MAFADEVASVSQDIDALLVQELPWSFSQDRQHRFVVHRRRLLTFLRDLAAPPTNHASERI